MARKNADDVVARGEDVPLQVSGAPTRDALLDPQPGDIIPDMEEKGYHVGTVRQPAEPVLRRSGAVDFETTSGGDSKFESPADQKARSNAREQENPDLYGGQLHQPISVDSGDITGVGSADRLRARGVEVRESGSGSRQGSRQGSTTSKLDRESAAVAKSQAADDKADK